MAIDDVFYTRIAIFAKQLELITLLLLSLDSRVEVAFHDDAHVDDHYAC